MKFVSFQSLLLPALVFLSSNNKEAFASKNKKAFASKKGLRNNNDDAVKDDDSRNLFLDEMFEDFQDFFGGENFLPKQLDFLQHEFSLNKRGQRPEYCHVRSFGSCKVDESDVCAISTDGSCAIGDNAHCDVRVVARCDTVAESCILETDIVTRCATDDGSFGNVSIDEDIEVVGEPGSYEQGADTTTIIKDPNDPITVTNTKQIVNPDDPGRRGLYAPPDDDVCIARAEGEVSCEFRNGRCELNVDKVCVLWVQEVESYDED